MAVCRGTHAHDAAGSFGQMSWPPTADHDLRSLAPECDGHSTSNATARACYDCSRAMQRARVILALVFIIHAHIELFRRVNTTT